MPTVGSMRQLARTGNRVLRPGAFHDIYANPWEEFARLTKAGVLTKLAHGYYLLVPEEQRRGHWTPEVEGLALGIALADYGRDVVALMGPAAARLLGAIPRALATATVAIPRQRPALTTSYGGVQFVTRSSSVSTPSDSRPRSPQIRRDHCISYVPGRAACASSRLTDRDAPEPGR